MSKGAHSMGASLPTYLGHLKAVQEGGGTTLDFLVKAGAVEQLQARRALVVHKVHVSS